jgi:hypothetical protein
MGCQAGVESAKLTTAMKHYKITTTESYDTIKLGIEAHGKWYYVARQLDGATPQPAGAGRRLAQCCGAQEGDRAVARQLAVDLWRLFTGQTTAENLGLIYLPEAA